MKKNFITLLLVLMMLFVLGACSDKKEPNVENDVDNNVTENSENDAKDKEKDEDEAEEEDELTALLDAIKEADDQLDLKLGDTGSFVTTLGTYDMTVTSAELKGYEFEGIESQLEGWIVLDVTIKNTSDKSLNVEDVIGSMDMTEDLEGSGNMDAAGAFDNVQSFEGEISPGEEQSAQFVSETYDSDMYYFRKNSGNVAGGSSNQVIWNISLDDM